MALLLMLWLFGAVNSIEPETFLSAVLHDADRITVRTVSKLCRRSFRKRPSVANLVAFDVRDRLKCTDSPYVLPADFSDLHPEAKLRPTICSLFCNLRPQTADIARTYEMTPIHVVSILVVEGSLGISGETGLI